MCKHSFELLRVAGENLQASKQAVYFVFIQSSQSSCVEALFVELLRASYSEVLLEPVFFEHRQQQLA